MRRIDNIDVITTYERSGPNSVLGYTLRVSQLYSSFDIQDINIIEKALKSKVPDGHKFEVDVSEFVDVDDME